MMTFHRANSYSFDMYMITKRAENTKGPRDHLVKQPLFLW